MDGVLHCCTYPRLSSVKEIHRHLLKDVILKIVNHEMGKEAEAIRAEKGELRQIVTDVLCRAEGLKAPQTGRMKRRLERQ
jgi:hypothetical protein